MISITGMLVDFASNTRFEDLPSDLVHQTKRTLLDCVGCGLAGISIAKGRIAIDYARQLDGYGESTIIGIGDKVSLSGAVFTNGELINALDYDPNTVPPGHVSPYVVPPVLAIAESVGASGKNLILGLALAHEISTRIGSGLASLCSVMSTAQCPSNLQACPLSLPDLSAPSQELLTFLDNPVVEPTNNQAER